MYTNFRHLSAIIGATLIAMLSGAAADAAPTFRLVWNATTGTGVTGTGAIDAEIGDVLELTVIVDIDEEGFSAAVWDLVGSAGLTAASNTLVSGAGGPPECPSPPNLAPGTCFSATFKSFTPLQVGVIDAGSSTTGYDVAGLNPEFFPSELFVGRGVFTVESAESQCVQTFFEPGIGGVTDGAFEYSVPAVAQASINGGECESPTPPTCEENLAMCESDFGMCEGDLETCDGDLETCDGELDSCLTDPPYEDADGDGEHDDTDACPSTAAGAIVDQAGCSQEQFCAAEADNPQRCNNADWRNDEPLGNALDCRASPAGCAAR